MKLRKKLEDLWKNYNDGNFGGNENEYFLQWRAKKRRSIFWRANLTIILAITLAVLTLIREVIDVIGIHIIKAYPVLHGIWLVFILFLLVGVIFAVFWEFGENKLEVSEQEKRFALGMRSMLSDTEKIKQEIADIDKNKSVDEQINEIEEILNKYLDRFIDVASSILCGNKTVHAGIMIHDPNDNSLTLFNSTPESNYEPLTIYLNETPDNQVGPAQKAFEQNLLAHMPQKSIKVGWVYEEKEDDKYDFKDFIRGWFEIPTHDSSIFESVISIPITSFAEKDKKAYHGVLNFTTDKSDHFIPRDYVMAFCFASIIAQAKDFGRIKINEVLAKSNVSP